MKEEEAMFSLKFFFKFQDDLQPFVVQHPEIIFVLIHFSLQYKSEDIKEFFRTLNLPNVVPFI
jgi:hypothetical protein